MRTFKTKLRRLSKEAYDLSAKIRKSPHTKNVLGFAVTGVIAVTLWSFAQVPETAAPVPVPIAYYKANDSADDDSGQGQNASNPEEAEFGPGIEGSAFDFIRADTQGLRTELDVSPDMFPSMTWSAWILPNQIDGRITILSADRGDFDRAVIIENGKFAIYTGHGLWMPVSADLAQWQHITVVFEPERLRFYKNGQEFVSEEAPTYDGDFENLQIGRNPGFGEVFHGRIDEVEIYDQALNANEITGIYNKFKTQVAALNPEPAPAQEQTAETAETAVAYSEESDQEQTKKLPPYNPDYNPAQNNPLPTNAGPIADVSRLASEIAQRVVLEKWDEPQVLPTKPDEWKIEDYRNKGKSRSYDYLGSVTLLLFLDGAKITSPILPAAERLEREGLKVVVLTPAFPGKIKEHGKKEDLVEAGMRALVPEIPAGATILSDPYGSVRYQLNLFAAPAVLFDKKGRILWKVRIGQRETIDTTEEFEKVARMALQDKVLEVPRKILGGSLRLQEKEIFGFENGWEGWELAGNAWNPPDENIQGPSSERHIPGLVAGYLGHRWISSFPGLFSPGTGTATSPEFVINAPYLHFLAGGGDIPENEGIALEVDGKFVRNFTPSESTYELKPASWDVSPYLGKKARIVVYDAGQKELRDGIMADAFTLSSSAEPPKAFASRHDPDEPAQAALVAGDLPDIWKELLAGNFYQKANPTWIFDIERVVDASPRIGARKLKFDTIGISENTPTQTVTNQKAEILVDGEAGTSKNVELKGTYTKEVLTAENHRTPKKSLQVRISARIAIREQELVMGTNPTNPDYEKREEFKLNIPKELPAFFKKEKILRWSNESDHAYILRVWRSIQRYYTDWADWGGWPIPKEMKPGDTLAFGILGAYGSRAGEDTLKGLNILTNSWIGGLTIKSIGCPAVGLFPILAQIANIPFTVGQGYWITNEIDGESAPHMRASIFLKGTGWVLLDDEKYVTTRYGQFGTGHRTGDTYFQFIDEKWSFQSQTNLELEPGFVWTTKSAVRANGAELLP